MNFRRSILVIVRELWRPEVSHVVENFCEIFAFFRKTTPYGKIFKILFRIRRQTDLRVVCKFREIWPTESR